MNYERIRITIDGLDVGPYNTTTVDTKMYNGELCTIQKEFNNLTKEEVLKLIGVRLV